MTSYTSMDGLELVNVSLAVTNALIVKNIFTYVDCDAVVILL